MSRRLAGAILLCVCAVAGGQRAVALSCGNVTLESALGHADVVFHGWVARMEVPDPRAPGQQAYILHEFRVWEVFKGPARDRMEIATPGIANGPLIAGAQYAFDPLKPALVFAREYQGRLLADSCVQEAAGKGDVRQRWLERLRQDRPPRNGG